MRNLLLLTDSYKVTHHLQYPEKTTLIYSYCESRGTGVRLADGSPAFKELVFFGLQYILKKYLTGVVVTRAMIEEAGSLYTLHFGTSRWFNRKGWEYILEQHGGRLPISIKALPEGSVVGLHNALFTVVNTDPQCAWLVNYLETLLLQSWYPITVASQSREMKKIIAKWWKASGSSVDGERLDFTLHDFGFRGATGVESSGIAGLAHLVNFKGTDTVSAVVDGRDYYGEPCAGFSIPAAEHSTIISWSESGEIDAMKNMLAVFGLHEWSDAPRMVAVVSDSFDIFRACGEFWGNELRTLVEQLGSFPGGRLVVRPDSGDPATIVIRVLNILGGVENATVGFAKFVTLTTTGHKLLPPFLRVIQGDGIEYATLDAILAAVVGSGWAAENLVFGSGGGLLQKVNRDTLKFAMKTSYIEIDGSGRDVFKDPVTDPGKLSKRGRLWVEKTADGAFITHQGVPRVGIDNDQLVEVYRDGNLLVETSLSSVRNKAKLD